MRLALSFAGIFLFSVAGWPAHLCAQAPSFEVASIKPTGPDRECGMIEPTPGGGLRVECLTLRTIVTFAYQVQDYQVVGGPAWFGSARWDIIAKPPVPQEAGAAAEYERMSDAERSVYMDLFRQRLRALLAERFQLQLHREMKPQTVYSLTVARSGPRMQEGAAGSGPSVMRRRGKIVGKNATMADLALFLATDAARPVTDETRLSGHYDFTIEWTPDRPSAPGDAGTDADLGPSLFSALQEQAGLKLVSKKGAAPVIVIDSARMPSEN